MNRSLILTFAATAMLSAGLVTGCGSDERPGLAPVPEGLEPRPELESIPANSVRVAVFQGGAEVGYDLVKGQRYFLVDESTDSLLSSDVADRDGQITIGEDGADFRGDNIWDGTVNQNSQIGLYVNRQLEEL